MSASTCAASMVGAAKSSLGMRLNVQLLSFGTLTRPFYAPTRHRNEDTVMHQMIRLATAAVLAVAFAAFGTMAMAQPVKQIKLTDKHVEGFIAAQQDMAGVAEKMQGSTSDKPDPKIEAELESIANKEKKQMLEELNDALKSAAPIQYPTNIEIVTKYYDKIDAVLQ